MPFYLCTHHPTEPGQVKRIRVRRRRLAFTERAPVAATKCTYCFHQPPCPAGLGQAVELTLEELQTLQSVLVGVRPLSHLPRGHILDLIRFIRNTLQRWFPARALLKDWEQLPTVERIRLFALLFRPSIHPPVGHLWGTNERELRHFDRYPQAYTYYLRHAQLFQYFTFLHETPVTISLPLFLTALFPHAQFTGAYLSNTMRASVGQPNQPRGQLLDVFVHSAQNWQFAVRCLTNRPVPGYEWFVARGPLGELQVWGFPWRQPELPTVRVRLLAEHQSPFDILPFTSQHWRVCPRGSNWVLQATVACREAHVHGLLHQPHPLVVLPRNHRADWQRPAHQRSHWCDRVPTVSDRTLDSSVLAATLRDQGLFPLRQLGTPDPQPWNTPLTRWHRVSERAQFEWTISFFQHQQPEHFELDTETHQFQQPTFCGFLPVHQATPTGAIINLGHRQFPRAELVARHHVYNGLVVPEFTPSPRAQVLFVPTRLDIRDDEQALRIYCEVLLWFDDHHSGS